MIWCVEDDGSIRDIEVYALQSAGLAARGFADGSSFWEAVQRERPDLVVLDIMLPGVAVAREQLMIEIWGTRSEERRVVKNGRWRW